MPDLILTVYLFKDALEADVLPRSRRLFLRCRFLATTQDPLTRLLDHENFLVELALLETE